MIKHLEVEKKEEGEEERRGGRGERTTEGGAARGRARRKKRRSWWWVWSVFCKKELSILLGLTAPWGKSSADRELHWPQYSPGKGCLMTTESMVFMFRGRIYPYSQGTEEIRRKKSWHNKYFYVFIWMWTCMCFHVYKSMCVHQRTASGVAPQELSFFIN